MRAILASLPLVFVVGCANYGDPGDLIRDRSLAIRTAQKNCEWDSQHFPSEVWHAEYRGGVWDVWETVGYGDMQETIRVDSVRAKDGKDFGCALVVG